VQSSWPWYGHEWYQASGEEWW